ncbi:hypothetical protein QCD85_22915 [Paenibacillus sp. PsM32]|uniref:hypothetical protein n=1 Tax=Paenibacillus sp. PsM32 TaxID=3030536 RepID=UPI00263B4857|nr:hypothetical protein [Paenibacillus sp. PsM32]MDN4620987.1 hypothetical protein [Paenibacillus sp. PsM32]
MNTIFDLGKFRKAIVWKEDYPPIINKAEYELKTLLQLNEPIVSKYQKLVLELKLPRNISYYALLGVEYIPNQNSELMIKVKVNDSNRLFYNSELQLSEEIYSGIPTEYANSIINSAKEKILECNWNYAGSIVFLLGAHSLIGSSETVFSKVTKILIALLSNELSEESCLSDDSVIKEELDSH